MKHLITSELVEAYLQCHRKAFLMLRGQPKGVQHEYEQILTEHARANRNVYLDSFTTLGSGSRSWNERPERCQDGVLMTEDLRADCDAISQGNRRNQKSHVPYEPHLVVGTHSVTKEHRLRLAFAGVVIGGVRRYRPKTGFIISVSDKPQRVRLDSLYPTIRSTIADLRQLVNAVPSDPPPLILTKHCSTCPFRQHCLREAEETDSLSLLERMTPKMIRKYQKKGIFTTNQLSYLFKPRRRRKRKTQAPPTFNVELQALALRTGKIYLNEPPSIPDNPVELFLDIEGIPDENFDYLIGLLVNDHGRITEHCFWADSHSDEQLIFEECLGVAAGCENAPIYHYGSYESKALLRAAKVHGIKCSSFVQRLVNVNSWIFGRVYFPSRSNGLKDLGSLIGATWDSPDASGLQSLVWRYRWEDTRCEELKQKLVEYNRSDCHALRLLVAELRDIGAAAKARQDIDFADAPKHASTERGKEVHRFFDRLRLSAHTVYAQKRLRIRGQFTLPPEDTPADTPRCGHPSYRRIVPSKANRIIRVRRRLKCPYQRHRGQRLVSTGKSTQHTLIDLVFTKNGCRKTVTRYVGEKAHCPKCNVDFVPPVIKRFCGQIYGPAFQAFAVYQRVALRLPYEAIANMIDHLFSEQVSLNSIVRFVEYMHNYHHSTERLLLDRVLASPFVHVDETKISIKGILHYVWIVTDGRHAVFRLTETRETSLVQHLLGEYKGVLVSDFYPGYDSIPCRQQKCWVHLIRDLNEDLWKNPYNEELERFVSSVRDLLEPIFEDVDKYGLKVRHLKKHHKIVDRFYRRIVDAESSSCEIVSKYQKRFQRYRESLFTFLNEDGIPWNNNTAENGLRHLALQRKVSGSFSLSRAEEYLRLLGIAQTCRFQKKSFLRFLLSGEKDVDGYNEQKRRKATRRVGKLHGTAQ
ncbi:MAG: IS66 family transposase [Planctomycetes bacterium]|nr:IS66 family transposase [Planctomycetota bacterium]